MKPILQNMSRYRRKARVVIINFKIEAFAMIWFEIKCSMLLNKRTIKELY